MTRSKFAFLLIGVGLSNLLVTFNGCGKGLSLDLLRGTVTGNPNNPDQGSQPTTGTPSNGNYSQQLVGVIAAQLSLCHSSVTVEAAHEGLLKEKGFGPVLGLPTRGSDTLYEISVAEQSRILTVDPILANNCLIKIGSLACTDAAITSGYSQAPDPYMVALEIPREITECATFFKAEH